MLVSVRQNLPYHLRSRRFPFGAAMPTVDGMNREPRRDRPASCLGSALQRNVGQGHKRTFLPVIVRTRISRWRHDFGMFKSAKRSIRAEVPLHVSDHLAGHGVDCAIDQAGCVPLNPIRRSLIR